MLIFPQKENKATISERDIYILSDRHEINERLSQILHLAGFNNVKKINNNLKEMTQLDIAPGSYGVLIDIGASNSTDKIIAKVQSLVPRDVWCCVAGDTDSIALSKAFLRVGIDYFYLGSGVQNQDLIQAALSGIVSGQQRCSVNISVLGCKGGAGSTMLAYQLANKISMQSKMSTLFVQGKGGSTDLDIISGKKMNQGVISVNKYLELMSNSGVEFPDLSEKSFDKYNFVIFEESINTTEKEQLRQIIEKSSSLILVMDRSMYAIRMVRHMMELIEAVNRTGLLPRRIFICLIDTRPNTIGMLSIEEIQSLSGYPIDIVFPYSKDPYAMPVVKWWQKKKSSIDTLVQSVLGKSNCLVKDKRSSL